MSDKKYEMTDIIPFEVELKRQNMTDEATEEYRKNGLLSYSLGITRGISIGHCRQVKRQDKQIEKERHDFSFRIIGEDRERYQLRRPLGYGDGVEELTTKELDNDIEAINILMDKMLMVREKKKQDLKKLKKGETVADDTSSFG